MLIQYGKDLVYDKIGGLVPSTKTRVLKWLFIRVLTLAKDIEKLVPSLVPNE